MQLKGVWNKLFLFVFLVLVAALCFSSISAAQIPSAWDCLSTWDNPIWKNQFNTYENNAAWDLVKPKYGSHFYDGKWMSDEEYKKATQPKPTQQPEHRSDWYPEFTNNEPKENVIEEEEYDMPLWPQIPQLPQIPLWPQLSQFRPQDTSSYDTVYLYHSDWLPFNTYKTPEDFGNTFGKWGSFIEPGDPLSRMFEEQAAHGRTTSVVHDWSLNLLEDYLGLPDEGPISELASWPLMLPSYTFAIPLDLAGDLYDSFFRPDHYTTGPDYSLTPSEYNSMPWEKPEPDEINIDQNFRYPLIEIPFGVVFSTNYGNNSAQVTQPVPLIIGKNFNLQPSSLISLQQLYQPMSPLGPFCRPNPMRPRNFNWKTVLEDGIWELTNFVGPQATTVTLTIRGEQAKQVSVPDFGDFDIHRIGYGVSSAGYEADIAITGDNFFMELISINPIGDKMNVRYEGKFESPTKISGTTAATSPIGQAPAGTFMLIKEN